MTNLALRRADRLHGRHQGLAHRARPPRAARGDRRPRAVLRAQGRPDRPHLPAQGPGARRHDRHRARHARPDRVHRGRGRLLHRAASATCCPDITVDREQIVYRFAGVRPLPGPRRGRTRLRLARLPDRTGAARGRHGCHASSVSSAASGPHSARRPRTSPTTCSSCSRCRAGARPWACRSAEGAATRRRSAPGGSGSTRTARASPLERVATLLDRYGTVAADVIDGDHDRSGRRDALHAAHLQHRRAAASGAHGRASCTWTTCCCDARASRSSGAVTVRVRGRGRRGDRAGAGVGCARSAVPRPTVPSRWCTRPIRPGRTRQSRSRSSASR